MPTREEQRAKLAEYLLVCFNAGEIRRLLKYLPGGDKLVNRMPDETVAPVVTAAAAVDALEAVHYLERPEFWNSFLRERPRRAQEIEAYRALFVGAAPEDEHKQQAGERPRDHLVLLLVSANPLEDERLRVDEEFARIIERLRHRTNLRIVQQPALTFDRLRAALDDARPDILHVSTHGEPGALFFHPSGAGEERKRVSKIALIKLLHALGGELKLVLLNACASLQIAEGLVAGEPRKIPWAIGMVDPIYDDDAIDYSVALYDSIAAGRPIGAAHEAALAGLELNVDEGSGDRPPAEIPRLVPDDPAAANKYVLVRR